MLFGAEQGEVVAVRVADPNAVTERVAFRRPVGDREFTVGFGDDRNGRTVEIKIRSPIRVFHLEGEPPARFERTGRCGEMAIRSRATGSERRIPDRGGSL